MRRWTTATAALSLILCSAAVAAAITNDPRGLAPTVPLSEPPGQPNGATRARPIVPLSWLIDGDDYPATNHGAEGRVDVRLDIGTDGRVSACTIVKSSGFHILDSTACRLLTARAKFEPAHDREGRPITDAVSTRIVWREEAEWPPGLPALFVATMRAAPDGKVSCSYVVNGSEPAPERCLKDLADRMSAQARRTGHVAQETLVITMTPDGEAEPAHPEDHGRLAYDSEVLLSLAENGSILECRVIREDGSPSAQYWPPVGCEGLEPGMKAFEPGLSRMTIKSRRFERY